MLPSVTEHQHRLAAMLGISLVAETFDGAAAELLDATAEPIGFEPAQPSSSGQRAFAESLGANVSSVSKRVASAKIGELLFELNQKTIAELGLQPGDPVTRIHRFDYENEEKVFEQEFVVSSIQPNGRVFFKGGNGQGAWPTQLRKNVV